VVVAVDTMVEQVELEELEELVAEEMELLVEQPQAQEHLTQAQVVEVQDIQLVMEHQVQVVQV
jgi:hypothetical protein